MTATKTLHDLGQSLWLDNITRDLLDSGTLRRYIQEFSVTGLAGIDVDALAAQLLDEGAKSFVKSWKELLASIESKGDTLKHKDPPRSSRRGES